MLLFGEKGARVREMDPKKQYVVDAIIRCVAGALQPAEYEAQLGSDPEIDKFLQDTESRSLMAYRSAGSEDIKVTTAVETVSDLEAEVHILKKGKGPLPDKVEKHLLVVSNVESPLFSLWMAIHHIYAPKLLGNGNVLLDHKMQEALVSVESKLHDAILKRGVKNAKEASETDVVAIESIDDEYSYWLAASKVDGHESARAEAFAQHLRDERRDLRKRLAGILELNTDDVFRLLDDTRDMLTGLWNENGFARGQGYPQTRMEHIFGLLSLRLAQYVRNRLKDADLWNDSFSKVQESLRVLVNICRAWRNQTANLTSQDWSRWADGPYEDDVLVPLSRRLEEILELRSVFEELVRLLPRADKERLDLGNVFDVFDGLPLLRVSPQSAPVWNAALQAFNQRLIPIEQRTASVLKSRISKLSDRPHLLVGEFYNFQNLLQRPNIVSVLGPERERLLSILNRYLDSLRPKFDGARYDHEAAVQGILFANQMLLKIKQTSAVAAKVLGDVRGIDQLQRSADDMTSRVESFTQELCSKWAGHISVLGRNIESSPARDILGVWTEVSFTTAGQITVVFSSKLGGLVREVHQLEALGLKIPDDIQGLLSNAEKYYRSNLKLKQVANFFNTTITQMIPSQRGMLFQDIQRVTRIVSDHERQAWDSPIQCEKYVSRLMSAVEELSARNRKLRGVHFQLSSGIVELTGIDLLRQRDSWNDQLKKLQAIFTREERVTDADSMLVWRKHWDHQLYKAFEYQYRLCLESVNDNLFDIPVDLFFSRKRLNLRPPLEDLRAQYYRNLKKFLDLPKVFVGFNEGLTGETIYSFIPERNSQGLNMVYQNAEVLFDKLRDLCESHEHWVALGTVDIEEYVDTHLEEVKDYNRNFEILEEKRYLASKLPSSVKIGCFTVSFVPFKSALDDLMHRFSDALLLSLRKKAVLGLKTVEEFLNDAMQMLTDKPDSVHDLTKAKSAWKDFARKKKEMMLLTKKVYQKNTCLRQKGSLYLDLSGLKPRWETFVSSMTSFDDVLEGQRESLKGGVEKRIKKLSLAIQKFTSRWRRAKPETDAKQMTQAVADKILSEISDWKEELAHLSDMATTLVKDIEHFEMPKPDFSILEDTKKEIEQHASGWSLYDEYNNGLSVMTSEAWVAFRAKIFTFEDFLVAWVKKLKGRPKDIVYEYIVKELKAHKQVWPILQKVTGELFEAEHWKLMFAKLKFPADVTLATVTMGHFLEAKDIMMSEQKFLDNLAARARGEVAIRDAVEELRIWAENTEFSLLEHPTTSGKGTHLIKEWKELFTKLSDQQSLVGSLKESPYYPPFADQASDFENKLVLLDGALHDINQIQRKWVYLEPIFGRGALPQEAARFKRIDSEFRAIMDDIHENPNVMALASYTSLKETVKVLLDQLERCQKALNDFLEEKRSKFPRFYFIGDDDLLEILGQSQNPAVIQNHLKKLFAGIHAVEFSEDKKNIVAMKSSKGEVVAMHFPVKVTEKVEEWLQELSDCMKVTLAKLTASCASEQALNYKKYPSQVLCLSEMVSFTVNTERAITSGKLSKWHAALKDKLEELTSMDTKTSKLLRLKVQALVMDLIHNIDVVKLLLENNVSTLHNWLWQKQLRFYFNEKQYVQAVMTDATFDYTYEYQGNAGKLVHTPLTDKCYLVLTQGMHLGYGGNPYGPAGTGKTESVKALGAALGRQVLVFNCDEGIDFQSMGRIFMGLVKSGAWGCFDEFNRLKEDQLSAVSQQIQVIQAAIKAGDPECELLNHTIEVNRNAGIFVTMNPASKEYGGRSKLPHNLKQLFRAVAMSVPDNALIAETILYSQGFKYAHDVGHKLVQVYMLSRQLLTPQKHYDWGLRALKTILSHGGQLIQKEKQAGTEITLQLESKLIIGSLKINTLSKLTYDDSIRFNALINDVFPGIEDDEIDYKDLEAAIRSALDELELEQVDSQIKKILQLNEALQQRMGVVVVGPSGCGKTVMLNVLHLALKKLGQSVVRHVMNPKALEREKLLGHMDHDTREWFDGVLTASARQVMKESHDTHSWVICDGDIDPEWVESLNSVLDDNRLLTMPNGERIAFGSNVNFVFETHDLQFASPATISRMGMIFLSEENTDIRSLVTAWIRKQPQDMHGSFTKWMDKLFYKALEWNMESGEFVVASTKVGLVSTALTHLSGVTCKGEFVCGLIRGMGSNLPINKRVALAQEVFEWAGERPPERHAPLDCFWNPKVKAYQQYVHQDTAIDSQTLSVQNPPMIHTVDIQRNMAMIKPWLTKQQPFILVGPEGCGKTLLLTNMFKDLKATSVVTIHCSAQTQSKHVIQKLDEGCASFSTKTGRVLRPKEGERLILFLKDLNLPKPDIYDTIQMIAFLQQLVTYQGFHDDNLDWVGIENVQIVASMNPATTVGRSELSTRFTAIVNVAFMNYPDQDQLQIVYASYLRSVLSLSGKLHDNSWRQDSNIHRLTSAMMGVYEKLKRTFSADDHRHYLFNPRDVTQWVFGLLRYDLATQDLLEVWTYEANRLFCDRLVNRDATNKFENIIADLLRSQFKTEIKLTTLYYTTLQEPQIESKEEKQDDSSSSSSSAASEVGPLLERVSNKEFKQIVSEFLHNYERENKNLRMLLFPEILDHIAYEDRVLSRPGGSLLLVGDSGVGRRTATQLVCFIHRMTFCSPNITLSYDQKSFRSELKDLLKLAGVENKKVCLYIEDHQIVYEGMLEDVNSLLSAGQVPGMYMPNELEPLLTPIKEEWSKDGRYRNPWNFFVHRIRTNLRIVLGFDPRNPKFGIRCESNPAIYTQCTIIWMGRWSKHGMLQVPVMRLKEIMGKNPRKLIEQIFIVHGSMLQRGATPLKYVAFLDTYLKLYKHHQTKLQTQQQHLAGGLQKLQEAGAMVDTLSKEASEKKELVIQKQKEADEGLERITESMQQASERRTETETLQKVLAVEEKNLSVRQGQIAEELKEVEPVLEKARNDVNGIRKDNLSEIRAFRMPPPAIHHVLAGVLTLLKIQDLSWENMRKFVGSSSLKSDIINFDAATVDKETRQKVTALIKKNPSSFEQETIKKANVAAAPLASWVKANLKCAEVLAEIAPLRAEFAAANAKLTDARTRLTACEQELAKLDKDVVDLKESFSKTTSEAEELKDQLKKTTEILTAAQSLLGKLSGEQERWQEQVGVLTTSLETLSSQALIAAGFTTYLAGYAEDIRRRKLGEWLKKFEMTKFDYMNFMSSESEFLKWKAEGLPSDTLSMQNGLVVEHTVQTPFIIDPNMAAAEWLKTHLEGAQNKSVEAVIMQDPRFVTTLELAVRFGKTLIIQEVDGVHPILYPLIRRDLCRQGPRMIVMVGDKAIDYNDGFRLYLVTRDPAPDISSDAKAMITEINFTVTRSGLEGQLLGMVLNHEKPELEKEKSALLAKEDALKIQLADLEKSLLQELAASEGNILENKALIVSLDQTKEQSTNINEALQNSKTVQKDLDKQRNVYRPIAKAGSITYFLIAQLSAVNNMYQFSLPMFNRLFQQNLQRETDGQTEARIKSLIRSLTLSIFHYVTRSIFKADRSMFALHLIHCLHPEQFQRNEWEYLTGELVVDVGGDDDYSNSRSRLPRWATSDRAGPFDSFCSTFPELSRQLQVDKEDIWDGWARSGQCENNFPSSLSHLTPFQQLLCVHVFRPDRLQSAIVSYACKALGVSSLAPTPLNFESIWEQSSPDQPIMFITSAGADPTQELEDFAVKKVGKHNFSQLAMGSGQTDAAVELLREAVKEGKWLCLKNLHLVTGWLQKLEKLLKGIEYHQEFRLWLTTEPHTNFPNILLQQSLKITYESPPGVKQNLLRTYESWEPEYISKGSVTRAQTLFCLAWFHAIVQERRTYIPQGFTKFYEFSFADLRSGADIIDAIYTRLNPNKSSSVSPDKLPWTTIWGLMEFAIYGGRIDNDHDVRVLVTYLKKYFSTAILGGKKRLFDAFDMPNSNNHADYKQLILSLSDTDMPSVFCLPANIEGAVQQSQATYVLSQLRKLAVSSAMSKKFNREQWRSSLSPLLQLWEKLTSANNKSLLDPPSKLSKKMADLSPTDSFVALEMNKIHSLVMLVNTAMSNMNSLVYGSGLLTPEIQSDGLALLAGETPWRWARNWYGPEAPSSWIKELAMRKMAIVKWMDRVERGSLLSGPLNLAQLFQPSVFLNALRQQTARVSRKPIDSLKLTAAWDSSLLSRAAIKVDIEGMLLQGCLFEGGALSALRPESSLFMGMPNVTLAYISQDEPEPYGAQALPVPIYFAASREEFIAEIKVPCRGDAESWILSGVALLLTDMK